MLKKECEVHFLGMIPYAEALQLQKLYHEQIVIGDRKSTLLLLEHPAVITLGKHASSDDVMLSNEELKRRGLSLEHVDRGGEATAHEPGQLVIYPLIDLRAWSFGAKAFVEHLEDVIIKVLDSYGIAAHREENFPGVWVGMEKVCSIGIRISRGVSYHGLALNVSNSLDTFTHIIPCGIRDRTLTSINRLSAKDLKVSEVAERVVKIFCQQFDLSIALKH